MNRNQERVAVLDRTGYFTTEYACQSSSSTCTSIVETENNVQLIFSTGLTIIFTKSKINLNEFQVVSWLSSSISLVDTATNYTGKLVGLMGNYNGIANDDVFSRTGIQPTSLSSERSVYEVATTWQLGENDTDLFAPDSSVSLKTTSSYTPSFLEDIVASNTDPNLNKTCNYVQSCVADALISGLTSFGEATGSTLTRNSDAEAKLSIVPPKIEFKNATGIRIDWSDIKPITLVAEVTSFGSNNPIVSITQNFTNAVGTTVSTVNVNAQSRVVTITYTPAVGEYPIFE